MSDPVAPPNEREVLRAIELADEPVYDVVTSPMDAGDLVRLTASEVGLPLAQLCSRRRTIAEIVGRRVAVHAAARIGIRGADVAAALGLSQQAASRINRAEVPPAVEQLVAPVLALLQG